MKPRTTARARLLTASAVAFLLAFVLILSLPTPAAAFPTHKIHDRSIAAAGLGGMAVGDVNGDAVLDIAVLDEAAGSVVVFTQGATGLPATPSVSIATEGARKIALEDIDVDGDADLIVVRSDQVAILYNDWGEFDIRVAEIAVPGVTAVAIADFGSDSLPDLATLTDEGLHLWYQSRSAPGVWASKPDLTVAGTSTFLDVMTADVFGDGRSDLILVQPQEIRIYRYKVDTTQLPSQPVRMFPDSLGGPVAVRFTDLDGDGAMDLVFAARHPTEASGTVTLHLQRDGAFETSTTFTGGLTERFALGDLNDDGRVDLAIAEFGPTVAVFLQRIVGGFETTAAFRLALDTVGVDATLAIGPFSGRPFSELLARVPGSLLVFEQDDLPPALLRTIPSDIVFTEGTLGTGLVDLRNYFSDDHGLLKFSIVYQEKPGLLWASIAEDGYHLDFEAIPGWYGTTRFLVAASDSAAGRAPVMSNTFSVTVNARPMFASTPLTEIVADGTYEYQAMIEDPYPLVEFHTFTLEQAPGGMTIDTTTGLVEWRPSVSQTGAHLVRLRASDSHGGVAEQIFAIRVGMVAPVPPIGAYVGAAVTTILAALGFGALASENVKYGLVAIFLPMYSKIRRERVLDHFVRGQIYGYVLANPGEHYNAIKVALNLTNGSLAHHLKTLERERFIKSKRFGLYRRFYPINMRIPDDDYFAPNMIQRTIVDLIRTVPGITQKEIANRLGLTPPTVNYHINILGERRVIRVERAGRKTHCFVPDTGPAPAPRPDTEIPGPATQA